MAKWSVILDDLSHGGFAPQWYRESYPSYGNNNHAADMTAMDLSKAGYLQPGPAVVVYPGSVAAITTTIRGMTHSTSNATTAYAVGGNKFYTLAASATATHTISASSASITAHDIAGYGSAYYYTWATTGTANIGRLSGSTYLDSWWTGTMSATALQVLSGEQPPRPIEVGGNDTMYFGNGRYVGSFDSSTSTAQDKALDLPINYEVQDIRWFNDRLVVPANHTQYGKSRGSIFIWDGTTNSWESEVEIAGNAGPGYVHKGVYYQFYEDRAGDNRLAYMDGNRLIDLTSFDGSLPKFYQISTWRSYLAWIPGQSSDDIYAFGSERSGEPSRLFHLADTGVTAAGGISNALDNLMFANNGQLYYLNSDSTYATSAATWKSITYDIAGANQNGAQINAVRFNFEKLVSGAALNWSLKDNQGRAFHSDTISYAKAAAGMHTFTTAYYPLNGKVAENFRVELDYSVGSSTAPVRVINIKVYGDN